MRNILRSREVASVRFLIFVSNREGGRRLCVGYYTQCASVSLSHSCDMTAIIHKFPRERGREEASVMFPPSLIVICCDSTWVRSTNMLDWEEGRLIETSINRERSIKGSAVDQAHFLLFWWGTGSKEYWAWKKNKIKGQLNIPNKNTCRLPSCPSCSWCHLHLSPSRH